MTEIKRYDVVLVDGVPAHRPSESGRWVKHGDLAAIVAEKDVRIAELESAKRSVTENYLRVTAERNEALYKVIELQEQVRALAEFRGKVRDSFEMGELAEDFAVFVNIQNAMRRSDCLSAIEREFFTREVPDEDYPDEIGEECDLSWGKGPVEYTENFRIAIREIRAQGVDLAVHKLQALGGDTYASYELECLAHSIRAGEQP